MIVFTRNALIPIVTSDSPQCQTVVLSAEINHASKMIQKGVLLAPNAFPSYKKALWSLHHFNEQKI